MVDYSLQRIDNQIYYANDGSAFRQIAKWLVVVVFFAALLLVYASLLHEILSVGYEMEKLKRENLSLENKFEHLKVEYNALVDPLRIEEEASDLGLITSSDQKIIVLEGYPAGVAPGLFAQSRPHGSVLKE